jgi:glutamyl-tRNA reductase
MHVHCLGLNHQTANISLRERMAFDDEKITATLARLSDEFNAQAGEVNEMVILSTCNRVELYAASPLSAPPLLLACLADFSHGLKREEFEPYTYHLVDRPAITHLFRVAAGLDSLVLGEPQILGQVTHALELARGQNAAGLLLSRLFQAAILAGKRARTETGISRNPASVSSLAAGLAERAVPRIDLAQVVILGAGEMADLAVEALRKRGVSQILVLNRTLARARELAGRWDAQAGTFEHLEIALVHADIVIASTGAPQTIIQSALAEQVMHLRPDRPLVAIDIAVPRDIDPEVGNLPGISLYDIDSLKQQLEHSLAERSRQVPLVETILAEEQDRFMAYLKTLEVLPLIADLHQQADAIRQSVLEKTLRRLPDLNEAERAHIVAMTRSLVKRLLDAPIRRLRAEAETQSETWSQCPYGPEYASVVRSLFGLSIQAKFRPGSDPLPPQATVPAGLAGAGGGVEAEHGSPGPYPCPRDFASRPCPMAQDSSQRPVLAERSGL